MSWKRRDPNKKSNYHKFERIVPKHKLAQVRQEVYNRAINQGASPHMALVKFLI